MRCPRANDWPMLVESCLLRRPFHGGLPEAMDLAVDARQRLSKFSRVDQAGGAVEHVDGRQPVGESFRAAQMPFQIQRDPGHMRPHVEAVSTVPVLAYTTAPRGQQV